VLGRWDQQLGPIACLGEVGDRPVAAVGQQRGGPVGDPGGGKGGGDGREHGLELEQVVGLLGELGGDHQLPAGGHRLGVVALEAALARVHQPAVRIGHVRGGIRLRGLIARSRLQRAWLATSGDRGGIGSGPPLLVAVLAGGGVGLQPGGGLPQPGQPAGLPGERSGQLVAASRPVLRILAPVGVGGLLEDLGDLGLQLGQGPVGDVTGVAGELGAVQGDHAELNHSSLGAQSQGGDQEPGQGLLVADPEPRDGDVVGGVVGGQHSKGDVLDAAAFDRNSTGSQPGSQLCGLRATWYQRSR
jgi:hypothetical protein